MGYGKMRKILVIGDLHVGSSVAPLPDYLMLKDYINGQWFNPKPTDLQDYLFKEFSKQVYNKEWDIVLVNGDVCDGPNKGSGGRYCWSVDMRQQIEAAYQMLSPIECNKMLFTMGTPYHSEEDSPAEEQVAEKLGAQFQYDYLLNVDDWKIHVAHCVDYKGGILHTLAGEMGTRGADITIRSHRHEYGYVTNGRRHAIGSPCWQWRTHFGIVNGHYGGTDIGTVEIHLHDDYIDVRPHLVDMRKFNQELKL
jgi:hypothetical protein